MAENTTGSGVGIDDPQQHPQRGGLARAIRAEDAIDRALGDGDVNAIDGSEPVEMLDQTACFNRQGAFCVFARFRARIARHLPFP